MSPDGRYVAFKWQKLDQIFQEVTGDRRGDIYVTPLNGDTPIQLTATEYAEANPTWSPDGTRIAFLRNNEEESTAEIVVKPLLGGSETLVATAARANGLDWSPDGNFLA